MNVLSIAASTEGQHADRALISLREFAQSKNWQIPKSTLRMPAVRSWIA
jgi:hypothetical protein